MISGPLGSAITAGKLTAGAAEPFLRTPYFESVPSFSFDGDWMLYGRGVSGKWDVCVQPVSSRHLEEAQISQGGGRIGRWLSNGRGIVYRTDDHRSMVVSYRVKNGTFIPGESTEWTRVRLGDTGVTGNFDVSGDRVLGLVPVLRDEAERARTHAPVIPGFVEEVRRRLARGGT